MILDFRFFLSVALLFFIASCGKKQVVKETSIFDFQAFFANEMTTLNANGTTLTRTIIDKENVFSNNEKKPDWTKELTIFKTLSLIKPEQADQYEIDTLRSDRGFVFITYSAEDPQLKLQLAEVMYNPDKRIEKITLIVKTEGKINNSDMTLTYLPSKGYDIKGDINSKIAGRNMLDIHVECTN